jgi:catechol 2,3-dioxygenase-like lactoylglutathione lyase family enzyme
MAIIGIETVRYCVDDVALCTRFFDDFGLAIHDSSEDETTFLLPNNAKVELRSLDTAAIPGSKVIGPGVHKVIWGVDTSDALARLIAGLSTDREIRQDEDGTAHFLTDDGIAMGLRLWHDRRAVVTATDPVNTPGNVQRLNTNRKWIARARPKYIQHVVFMSPDPEASFAFMRDRLNFRMSDHQRFFGIFARADGTTDHHNIYFLNAKAPLPGADGQLRFHHTNFGVTDIDEIMVGKNYMERRGWPASDYGLGRHRIASALFLYLPAPTGGEAEYGADSDALDDNWIPRTWDPLFGFAHWVHEMPAFWSQGADWDVGFVAAHAPSRGSVTHHDPSAGSPVVEGAHPDATETERTIALPRELRETAK